MSAGCRESQAKIQVVFQAKIQANNFPIEWPPRKPIGPFKMPTSGDPRDFAAVVDNLPEEDKPSMFGLPANIERAHQRLSSAATIGQLKVRHPIVKARE